MKIISTFAENRLLFVVALKISTIWWISFIKQGKLKKHHTYPYARFDEKQEIFEGFQKVLIVLIKSLWKIAIASSFLFISFLLSFWGMFNFFSPSPLFPSFSSFRQGSGRELPPSTLNPPTHRGALVSASISLEDDSLLLARTFYSQKCHGDDSE